MDLGVRAVKTCRSCGSARLEKILDLGIQYVSNFVEADGEGHAAPLTLIRCADCTLAQLSRTVPPQWHYERGYWFKSGTNEQMVKALRDIVDSTSELVTFYPGDVVADIGSNDGTLLRMWPRDTKRIGFDPAENYKAEAEVGGNEIRTEFFPPVGALSSLYGKAKVITAIAMFYDLDEPAKFLRAIKAWLHPGGVFVVQMAYAPKMIETNDVGNVSHEHLCYYTVQSFASLLERYGLKIDRIAFNDVNGGSFRCFIRHGQNGIREDLVPSDWEGFAKRVAWNKARTLNLLEHRKLRGQSIGGYGASTRGNTILQYYGVGPELVPYIAERNPLKWGKKTVGTNIPIVSEEEFRLRNPDWVFVLPWHLMASFREREPQFAGRWIVPLPQLTIQ